MPVAKVWQNDWCFARAKHQQGLTLRSQRHLPIGQVQVMFYLPEGNAHLPEK